MSHESLLPLRMADEIFLNSWKIICGGNGGGVSSKVLKELITTTAASEFHSASLAQFAKILPDPEEIKRMLSVISLSAAIL
jgi:copper homeostasis protein CutC